MPCYLELWDVANTTRLGRFSKINNARCVLDIEGENTLDFSMSIKDALYSQVDVCKWIRVVREYDTAVYYSFQIANITEICRDRINISAEGLKYALLYQIFTRDLQGLLNYSNIENSVLAAAILSDSGFTLGSVSGTSEYIELSFATKLEALQAILDSNFVTESGVVKNLIAQFTEAKVVNLLAPASLGSDKNFYVSLNKNMKGLTISTDARELFNKVYGVGAEGHSIQRANKVDYEYVNNCFNITPSDQGATYIEDNIYINTDDEHNGMAVLILSGTSAGSRKIITDTIASTHRITFSAMSPAPDVDSYYGVAVMRPYDETSDEMTYQLGIKNASSDGVCPGTDFVLALWQQADFDGAGSCDFTTTLHFLDASDNELFVHTHVGSVAADGAGVHSEINIVTVNIGVLSAPAAKVKFVLEDAVFSGTTGDTALSVIKSMTYSLSVGQLSISNSTSITAYGTREGKYENGNIQDTVNLVKSPDFSGTYGGGVCADWTLSYGVGTEITSSTYIRNGTKTQKLSATGVGGIQLSQRVYIEPNTTYSLWVNYHVTPASSGLSLPKVIITPQTGTAMEASITGSGWGEILIEGFSYDCSYIDIEVSDQPGFDAIIGTVIYLDAVQLATGAEIKPFINGDSADKLYSETNNYMLQHKDPAIEYTLNLKNMYELNPAVFTDENFDVGDRIRIVDSDKSIDTRFTVIRKEFDPLFPVNCNVKLTRYDGKLKNTIAKAIQRLKNKN